MPASGWPQPGGYPGQYPPADYQGQPGQYPPAGFSGAPDQYAQANYQGYPPQGPPGPGQFQEQPGQWPQPAGPTPAPRRRNPAVIIVPLAVVAAVVLGLVIAFAAGGGDDDSDQTVAASTPATVTLPSLGASGAAAPGGGAAPGTAPPAGGAAAPQASAPAGCTPLTPANPPAGVAGLGGSSSVTGKGTSSYSTFDAKATLNSVCTSTARVEEYGDPPVQGAFYVLNVTVEVSAGDISAAPDDFYIQTTDGSRYDGEFSSLVPKLYTSNVKAGQKVTGFVLIDAPLGHFTLNWEPLFAVQPAKFQL